MQSEKQNSKGLGVHGQIIVRPKIAVPIKLVEFCNQNKLTKELRLFLLLKMTTPGQLDLNKVGTFLGDFGVKDKRTLTKYIKRLIDIKFAGCNHKSSILYIRSFKRVQCETKTKGNYYSRVYSDTLKSSKLFKGWVTGTIAKSIARKQGYKLRRVKNGKTSELIRPLTTPSLSYVPEKLEKGISVRYYGANAGVSKSKAQRDLKLAQNQNLISRQKREIPLEFYENGEIVCQPNRLDLPIIYKEFPQLLGRVWMKATPRFGLVPHIRIPDMVYSTVEFFRKRNFSSNK